MIGRRCPDCVGAATPGLIYGVTTQPTPCVICWGCGWQSPAVYRRTSSQRNSYAGVSVRQCGGCGSAMTAAKPGLHRAFCDACYAARRDGAAQARRSGLSAAAVSGRIRRVI